MKIITTYFLRPHYLLMLFAALTFQVSFAQQSIGTLGTAVTQNFNGMGTSATAALPTGFKIGANWASGTTATTHAAGTTGAAPVLNGTSAAGVYNYANGANASSTDRAVGFLTSSGTAGPYHLVYAFTNNTGVTVNSISISFNYEKYRSGTRAFNWTFYHGSSSSPTTAETAGDQAYPSDANNTTIFNPPQSVTKTFTISGLAITNGASYYLRWNYSGNSNAQALAVDDFSITLNVAVPEINVQGNGQNIADGDTTPSLSDHTDFGSQDFNSGSITRTFTIQNTGSGTLNLTGSPRVTLSGSADFVVSAQPSAETIAGGQSLTFEITFDPSSASTVIASVNIASNDADEALYNFDISGTGTAGADVVDNAFITSSATPVILAGENTTVTAGVFESGVTEAAGAGAGITVEIGYNTSDEDPSLNPGSWTWLPATYSGDSGGDDLYQATFGSSLAPGTYYFAARAVKMASSVYVYAGTGTLWNNNNGELTVEEGPEIDVAGLGAPIADGDTTPETGDGTSFGTANPLEGESLTRTFVIHNTGGTTLNIGAVTITGPGAEMFYIIADPETEVEPTESTSFEIEFFPSVGGVFTATVNIVNDDANENPYNFDITGTGTATNDDCSMAIELPVNAAPLTADSVGATQSIPAISCSGFTGNANDDTWFSFTTGAAGTYIITVDGDATYDAVVDLRSGACNGTNIACADSTTNGGIETISTTLAATTTYYIRVYDYDGDVPGTTTFSIRVSTPPSTLSTNGTTTLTFPDTNALSTSTSQTFNLSGTGLTGAPGNITVTAPNTDFQVSNNNTSWGPTTTIAYTSGTLASTPVYVRFSPQSAGAKSGDLTFSGGGVSSPPTIALSGNGLVPPPDAPLATAATNVMQTSFTANWDAVAGATGYFLDVSTSPTFGSAVVDPVAVWNFPLANDNAVADGGIPANASKTITAVGGLTNIVYNAGGATTSSARAEGWDGGNGSKAWEIEISTIGYSSLTVSSKQRASNTGPRDFKLQYKIGSGGTYTDVAGGTITTAVNFTNGVLNNVPLPSAADNQPSVYLRWIMASNTSVNLGTVAGGGTSNIDDIIISGNQASFVTGYNNLSVGNVTSYNVTGLAPETTYHYRVRATNGTLSANSDPISITTKPTAVTWNGTAWSNITGPDIDIEAVIAGPYVTGTNGEFAAKKLTVNSGSLTVSTGTDITIANELVNNLAASAVVFENNANLMQQNDVDNSGPITVKRNSSALRRLDYTLWSSPVAGQNLLAFSPLTVVTPTSRFYQYNSATNLYSGISAPGSVTMDTAKGYLIRMPNNHPTFPWVWTGSFAGVPNNGDYTFDAFDGGEGFRYNLVGNPYPSPISGQAFFAANSANTTQTLYFWRETNQDTSNNAYVEWVPSPAPNGTYNGNGQPEAEISVGIIQTGQGFFVELSDTPADIVFTNAMRVNDHADQFYRMSENATPAVEEYHRLWLNVTNADGAFCQTTIAYLEGATMQYDAGKDAKYMNTGNTKLYTLIGQQRYSIQGRSLPFESSDVVSLGFEAATEGTYSIALDHVDGLFTGDQQIYLRDNLNGSVHNLKDGAYSFSTVAGTFESRFDVVYDSALAISDPVFNENDVVVYNQNGELAIDSGDMTMANVKVFDIRGRLVAQKSDVNASQVMISAGTANQVLIVKITSENNQTVTKKVVR